MAAVSSVSSSAPVSPAASAPGGPVSVAAALSTLKLRPGSTVDIADTRANILKNLDTLQGLAGRITGLASTDGQQRLSVTAAQFARNNTILSRWGEGDGNTVDVTAVAAANAAAFVAAQPAWVNSIHVADTATAVQGRLDTLQGLVAGGKLGQIVLTGASHTLRITAAQVTSGADALAAIKNQAYALAVTDASVSDTLGLDGQAALAANARVKSIHVKDGTDAIEANLDSLQRVGLRLKTIAQTDTDNNLTLSAAQYKRNATTLGKIITDVQLDVVRATAAQAGKLAAQQRVVTVTVADTAAQVARKWQLLQTLGDSLTGIEITDPDRALTLSADQVTLGEGVLGKFSDGDAGSWRLAVTGVRAGQAADFAAMARVASLKVADSADNLASNLDALKAVDGQGLLAGVAVTGRALNLAVDASHLLGDAAGATESVLRKVSTRHVGLAVTNAQMDALDTLADNARVVSVEVGGSSDEIEAHLDTLARLGRRLARIDQTDGGSAIDLTQAAFDARAGVLAKVAGGYSVNLTEASAGKALVNAMNAHVASIRVADTGRNLVSHWSALRAIGATLTGVSKTDDGALTLSAAQYLAGQDDALVGKFAADQKFVLLGASVAQARELADDDAVEQLDITDDGSAVTAALSDLAGLADAGKLRHVALNATTTRLALHASQLDGAQAVLDRIQGGRYSLALDQVAAGDAAGLLASNSRIASLRVAADAAGIVEHLADLGAAGAKLAGIDRSDTMDSALALDGATFERHRATLAKINGGYQAELSDVAAARASSLAAMVQVKTLQVADTGANLSASWNALAGLGGKLSGVAQSDDALLNLSAAQWAATRDGLGARFSTTLGLAIGGADLGDLASLNDDSAVQQFQLADNAEALAAAWDDLAAATKLTQLRVTDAANPLALSAATYAASGDLLSRIPNAAYRVALSDAALADADSLQADSHVHSMDLVAGSAELSAAFDNLAGYDKLGSITLSDDNGTLNLSASQLLGGADTLARIANGFQVAASGVTLAQLADVQALDDVVSIGITDSAAQVAQQLDDLAALGGTLAGIDLSDDSPVLALTHEDWLAGAGALARINGSYQVDLSQVQAGLVATLTDDASVRQLAVTDTAGNLAQHWDALVAAYADGSGKLATLALSDAAALQLSAQQQADGAALIGALLAGETIETVG